MTWTAPRDTGKPPINDYVVQYRKVGSESAGQLGKLWPHDEPTVMAAPKRVPR